MKLNIFLFIFSIIGLSNCNKSDEKIEPIVLPTCPANDFNLTSGSRDDQVWVSIQTKGVGRKVNVQAFLNGSLIGEKEGYTELVPPPRSNGDLNYNTSQFTCTFNNLSEKTEYTFTASLACDINDYAPIVKTISATTKARCILPLITQMDFIENSTDEYILRWNNIQGAAGYIVSNEWGFSKRTDLPYSSVPKSSLKQTYTIQAYCNSNDLIRSPESANSLDIIPPLPQKLFIELDTVLSAKYPCTIPDCSLVKYKSGIGSPNYYRTLQRYNIKECKSARFDLRHLIPRINNTQILEVIEYKDVVFHFVKENIGYKIYYKSISCPDAKNWHVYNNNLYLKFEKGGIARFEFFEDYFLVYGSNSFEFATNFND